MSHHPPPAGAMDIKNGAAVFIQNSTFVDNTGARGGAIVVEGNSGSIIQVCILAGCSTACMCPACEQHIQNCASHTKTCSVCSTSFQPAKVQHGGKNLCVYVPEHVLLGACWVVVVGYMHWACWLAMM
jgi:hypothetical protein